VKTAISTAIKPSKPVFSSSMRCVPVIRSPHGERWSRCRVISPHMRLLHGRYIKRTGLRSGSSEATI